MFDQLHSYITSVACTDPRRGTIVDWIGVARGGRYGKNITFFFEIS